MSTEVNRHTQANKIWVKMRRMRRVCLRMMDNVRHYVDEVHKKTAAFINRNFDMLIIAPFGTQSMMKKEKSEGKKRKLNATSARSMCSWSHYRFRTYLLAVMGDCAVVCGEHYTSKACGKCGRINHQLNSSKTFICRLEGCGFRADRDVSAWRNIVMNNFIAGLACAWKHTEMWRPSSLALVHDLVNSSLFSQAEIHLTEWASSSSGRDFTKDYLHAATFVIKANVDSIGSVDSLVYWTFTDIIEEEGAGNSAFHGGFGLVTLQGIPKPTFHAYRMLNLLGNELLQQTSRSLITRDPTSKKITALAYHYPSEITLTVPGSFETRDIAETTLKMGQVTEFELEIWGLDAGVEFQQEVLDTEHGDAVSAWKRMGCPEPLSREQEKELKAQAWATGKEMLKVGDDGVLRVSKRLDPWSVFCIIQK